MSTSTATAYRSNFTGRIAPARSRKSPEIKPFHGCRSTYSQKAHCIKDSVLLDPACGSGNFLTETYLCLRKLEDKVLDELQFGQLQWSGTEEEEAGKRISLSQFHGIEINDFAVSVAETALYISRLKANNDTMMLLDLDSGDLPLKESAHIVHGNALLMDWNNVIPSEDCSYIMGNPPFIGYSLQTDKQKKELLDLAVLKTGESIKGAGNLDYVCGWFFKAANYMENNACAFVSTNSIYQGEQAVILWQPLIESWKMKINFAYRPFIWNSEASETAHVHVAIVGISKQFKTPLLFYDDECRSVSSINCYLLEGPVVFIHERKDPLCKVEKMQLGVDLTDYGYLNFKPEEMLDFITREPESSKYFKKYLDARDFMNNQYRYYLDLRDCDELDRLPLCRERIELVRQARATAKSAATRKRANNPLAPKQGWMPDSNYLIIPRHTSGNRRYVPIGFMQKNVVATMANQVIPNATIYEFGVLQSYFHNAWIDLTAGRIKSDYRYGAGLVYNNFIWPNPTDENKKQVEYYAQAVLDARDNHPEDSLATLYDPNKMPDDLLSAHELLDAAVEKAYGVDYGGDEEKIVAHLFNLYGEAILKEQEGKSSKETQDDSNAKSSKATVKVKVKVKTDRAE